MRNVFLAILSLSLVWGCTDTYDEPLPEYESELIIEAYVNQANPLLNYALLSKSLPYYDENFDVEGVGEAKVTLYEGQKEGTELIWNQEGLAYEEFDQIPGLYLPPITEFFVGKEGYYYKLEVEYEGVTSVAVTQIPNLVPIDSIWVENVFNSNRDTFEPFLRFLFTDPPQFGNNYMIAEYVNAPTEWPLLWGAANRIVVTDDLLINSQSFVYSPIFPDTYGDTVNMYLISIDQQTLEYWESYDASRNNGGPFTQPINVNSTFDNARGTFQGMAVDNKRIIIK
jgi:hypothetical protein